MNTVKREARRAGFLYLLVALIAPLGLIYVPSQVPLESDVSATVARLADSAGLVRAGIVSELAHQIVLVFLLLALYRLFRPVDKSLAWLLVAFGALLSVPIVFVNVLNEIAALMLAPGTGFAAAFETAQREALAYLFLSLHDQGIGVVSMFWGLWLFPFGLLVIRSGFIPGVFGWLLLVAGASYVAASFTGIAFPQFSGTVKPVTDLLALCEIPIILWLVIRGAREQPQAPRHA